MHQTSVLSNSQSPTSDIVSNILFSVPEQVLILDTETTDLNVEAGQVIEIGAILYSVMHQTTIQQYSTLLPAKNNPAEHINRIKPKPLMEITNEQAAKGIGIITEMAKKAQGVVAHNADFDKKWFGSFNQTNNLLPALLHSNNEPLPWFCTCTDFTWPRQIRPGQSLIELALAHDIGVFGNHRALTDCQLIAALFDKMVDLKAMFEIALRPKAWFKAFVTYDNRELAKKAGFKWVPERSSWERKMVVEDTKTLPFKVMEIKVS